MTNEAAQLDLALQDNNNKANPWRLIAERINGDDPRTYPNRAEREIGQIQRIA